MSDFFGKLKKGLDKGVDKASKKSAELAGKTKLQTQIISLKNDKKNEINELGNLTYQMLKEGNLEEELLNAKFGKIIKLEDEILEKEDKKENISNEIENEENEENEENIEDVEEVVDITCPNCGEKNLLEAKFCKNCGTKLSE